MSHCEKAPNVSFRCRTFATFGFSFEKMKLFSTFVALRPVFNLMILAHFPIGWRNRNAWHCHENLPISQATKYDGYAQLKLENISKLKLSLVERILAQLECLKAILSVQISKNLNYVYSIEVPTEHFKHFLKVWKHQPLEWFESRIRISYAFYLVSWTRKLYQCPSRVWIRHGIMFLPAGWVSYRALCRSILERGRSMARALESNQVFLN